MKKLIMCLIFGIFLMSGLATAYTYEYAPTGPNGRYTSDYPAYHNYYANTPSYNYYPYNQNYYPTYHSRDYYYTTPYYRQRERFEYEYYTKSRTDIKNADGSRISDYFEERIKFKRY